MSNSESNKELLNEQMRENDKINEECTNNEMYLGNKRALDSSLLNRGKNIF
jgi:hypothetical protein